MCVAVKCFVLKQCKSAWEPISIIAKWKEIILVVGVLATKLTNAKMDIWPYSRNNMEVDKNENIYVFVSDVEVEMVFHSVLTQLFVLVVVYLCLCDHCILCWVSILLMFYEWFVCLCEFWLPVLTILYNSVCILLYNFLMYIM